MFTITNILKILSYVIPNVIYNSLSVSNYITLYYKLYIYTWINEYRSHCLLNTW